MITSVHEWSALGNCLGKDRNRYFNDYEASVDGDAVLAHEVDAECTSCKMQRNCLAFAVTHKEWGVWGGVYFEDGKISKRLNQHKNNEDWFAVWTGATMG